MNPFEAQAEVLDFAIAREIQACTLYTTLVDKVDDIQLKAVFSQLAQEEIEHKAKLELEFMKLGIVVKQDLQAVDDPRVDYIVASDINYIDVLNLCIDKERQAFRLYVELSQTVHQPVEREMLLQLAEQEARHKARFEIELERLEAEDNS